MTSDTHDPVSLDPAQACIAKVQDEDGAIRTLRINGRPTRLRLYACPSTGKVVALPHDAAPPQRCPNHDIELVFAGYDHDATGF